MSSSPSRRGHVVYISYDGVLEPLGESQVVAYLERLAARWAITLISFEKDDPRQAPRAAAMRARLAGAGIEWKPRRYHKRPMWLAKIVDVVAGSWDAWRAASGHRGVLVHARSYLPALMGLPAQRLAGAKLIFDIRGLWADERADRGYWARGGTEYRIAKWWERRFFASADAVVSLTRAAVRVLPEVGLAPGRDVPVRVIPTCVDLQRFAPGPKSPALLAAHALSGMTVFGCVGTMSRAYMGEEMLRYAAILTGRVPASRVLVVTQDDHETVRACAARAGLDGNRLVLVRASYADMPELIRLIDLGIFFIKPSVSARAASATKLAEFLATGVPVVVNDGIGDSSDLIRQEHVGVVISDLSERAMDHSAEDALGLLGDSSVKPRCREAAARHFDVDAGAAQYDSLYDTLHASP